MKNFVLSILAVLLFASAADACGRCGLFGRKCRFFAQSHHVEHIDKHYANSSDVFVINNAYPTPLIGQGSTQYRSVGYQEATFALLDPNLYFSQEQQLIQAAQDANALRIEKSLALFERVAEIQSPVAEKLATGKAAQMILEASGLSGEARASSSAIVINRDSDGRIVIGKLSQSQIAALNSHVEQKVTDSDATDVTGDKYPLLAQYCSKCHGLSLAQPKKSLHLGDDANVAKAMRAKFLHIDSAVRDGSMPPAAAPQPNDAERDGILREIKTIIAAYPE